MWLFPKQHQEQTFSVSVYFTCTIEQTHTHTKAHTLYPCMTGPCQQRAAGRVCSLFSQRKCVTAKCLSVEDDSIQAFTLALTEQKQGGERKCCAFCKSLCVYVCVCNMFVHYYPLAAPPPPPLSLPFHPRPLFSSRRLQAHSIIGPFDCILD